MMAGASASEEEEEELARLEEQRQDLEKELEFMRQQVQEARKAGNAVLTAAEAVMAPLMAELAGAQRACAETGQLAEASASELALTSGADGDDVDALPLDVSPEAEVQHLRVELQSCQEHVERMEVEQSHRLQDTARLQSELDEATEALDYEQRRARHYEACRPRRDGGGPRASSKSTSGLGLRTIEMRGEQQLREYAEQRAGKLAREVVRLAGKLAEQQATVERLTKELEKVRQKGEGKDKQLEKMVKQTQSLRAKLAHGPEVDSAFGDGKRPRRKKPKATQSTGKLPHLSF